MILYASEILITTMNKNATKRYISIDSDHKINTLRSALRKYPTPIQDLCTIVMGSDDQWKRKEENSSILSSIYFRNNDKMVAVLHGTRWLNLILIVATNWWWFAPLIYLLMIIRIFFRYRIFIRLVGFC